MLDRALQNQGMRSTTLKAACAVLKMLGADRVAPASPTTVEEVVFQFVEREDALRKYVDKLAASSAPSSPSVDAVRSHGLVLAATGTDCQPAPNAARQS